MELKDKLNKHKAELKAMQDEFERKGETPELRAKVLQKAKDVLKMFDLKAAEKIFKILVISLIFIGCRNDNGIVKDKNTFPDIFLKDEDHWILIQTSKGKKWDEISEIDYDRIKIGDTVTITDFEVFIQ